MPRFSHHLAVVALLFWLLSNWAGTHGHYCFDGQEPPMSVHMDVMGGHLEHHPDEIHQDADIDLTQSILAKLSKIELDMLLLIALVLVLVRLPAILLSSTYLSFCPPAALYRRPLLRAPPVSI
jgi:hypothetical protein